MSAKHVNYSRHDAQEALKSVSWDELRTIKANLEELTKFLSKENTTIGKKAKSDSSTGACLTLDEVLVVQRLVNLAIRKKELVTHEILPEQLYPTLEQSKEELSLQIHGSLLKLFFNNRSADKYGLIKLVTSSKAVEREVEKLCNNIKARFDKPATGNKDKAAVEPKTLRERVSYKSGQTLAALNAFGVAVSFVGILLGTFIWPLAAAIIVGSLVFAVGGILSWNMNKGSLPEIIADIVGKNNLFDELHKDLKPNKKVALWVGFGLAFFTGIVTAAFTWTAVVFLFATLSLSLPPLALAIFGVNAIAVCLLMFKSIHQLTKEPEIWHRFKKFFRQLFDPDAAQHKMLNKSKARVYIEGILAILILPIAIIGLITTILAFIPGLSQFALQHLPSAPRTVVNGISIVVGVVAALGEMPFTLKTMGLSVRQLFEASARLKNKTFENAKLMRENSKNYSKWDIVKEYASAAGIFLGRFCYAFTQGLINVDGSFGGGFAKFLSGFCGAIDAFAEVAEGDDNEEARGDESNSGDGNGEIKSSNESTIRLLNFFKDVEGRADRKEEKYTEKFKKDDKFKPLFFKPRDVELKPISEKENIREEQASLLLHTS